MINYNRYSKFTDESVIKLVPYIKIPEKGTDKYVIYDSAKHRFDRLSYEFYGDPNYGWLILMANPDLPSLEFSIEDGSLIRIPFPLRESIQSYIEGIDQYNILN